MLRDYADCHYAECHYAECHYAECQYAECHYARCHYAECHYSKCHNAECRRAECHGAKKSPFVKCAWVYHENSNCQGNENSSITLTKLNKSQGQPFYCIRRGGGDLVLTGSM
jgi:hypothetical protein